MFGRCKCKSFKPEIVNGYQFCAICGKAHLVEKPDRQYGGHVLNDVERSQISNHLKCVQNIILQKCDKCGMLFTFNSTKGQYDINPDETFCI